MPDKHPEDKSEAKEVSRFEAATKDGDPSPEFPPINAPHLIDYLFEIGPSVAAGMGEGPVTHADIAHFQANTGIELTSWEARTLRNLSREYLAEGHRAKSRTAKSPWPDYIENKPINVGNSLRDSIRNLQKI